MLGVFHENLRARRSSEKRIHTGSREQLYRNKSLNAARVAQLTQNVGDLVPHQRAWVRECRADGLEEERREHQLQRQNEAARTSTAAADATLRRANSAR